MALFPDYGRKIFSEENVDVPAGLKTVSAYDLALYPELGNHRRGVLVVTVIGSFTFKDGKKDDGTPLTWTGAQKTAYLNDFKRAAVQTWTDKHRITTASLVATIKDVGVMFDVRVAESMSVFRHSHWNIAVTRTDKYRTSGVYGDGGGLCTNGDAFLDSQDVTATNVGGPALQRACVHEFGHMPGYRDEYPTRPGMAAGTRSWLGDLGSVMSKSETVRPRHYVFFAHRLTEKFRYIASLRRQAIDWKVNGTVDLANARL